MRSGAQFARWRTVSATTAGAPVGEDPPPDDRGATPSTSAKAMTLPGRRSLSIIHLGAIPVEIAQSIHPAAMDAM